MRIIVPLLTIALFSCKNSEKSVSQDASINKVVVEQLGANFERKDNGELTLCYSVENAISKWKNVIVINKKSGELIYGPKKLNADVDWYSKDRLIIKEYPEVIQDKTSTSTFTYYYDLIAKKRISATK